MPIGHVTRGTTGTNRLRRVDRWIAALPALRTADDPLVVDLGYGASATTALELRARLARVRPDVRVHGFEIEPERVRVARAQLEREPAAVRERVRFDVGGFEMPLPRGERPAVVRAFNVLRQYDESEVHDAWETMLGRLAPGGVLVEGTCNEVGRVASWFDVEAPGPRTFTISLHLGSLDSPLVVAERLPKTLIHHNVPGEPIHDYLRALDDAWRREAPRGTFGARQRFVAAAERVRDAGWPLVDGPRRWRLGELTVRAEAVLPH
ncbi:hypothetical protein HNR16_000483 [Pseudoclavibacter chungangensis]|nr:class I SAM-dependent methyltransferase [Pseudoclavibacter chungangensis]NYJ65695.1 hypothetical protein [Pseudoclavibacter chungangensis]